VIYPDHVHLPAGLAIALCAAALPACQEQVADIDQVFSSGPHPVHCALNLDTEARNSLASIDSGLDRAADRGELLDLYAHHPGATVPLDKVRHVLAAAAERGLPFVTYADLAAGETSGPGLVLSFDDSSVDAWFAMQPLLDAFGARVTYFVSRYPNLSEAERAELRALADAGNAIEAHTLHHLRAPEYVEAHGLAAYLDDEVLPSIDLLRADGYDVEAFAYPYGSRTAELVRAVLRHVPLVRSVAFAVRGISDPCP
jgi:hypothetical protein